MLYGSVLIISSESIQNSMNYNDITTDLMAIHDQFQIDYRVLDSFKVNWRMMMII